MLVGAFTDAQKHASDLSAATDGLTAASSGATTEAGKEAGVLGVLSGSASGAKADIDGMLESQAQLAQTITDTNNGAAAQSAQLQAAYSTIQEYANQSDLSTDAQGRLRSAVETVNDMAQQWPGGESRDVALGTFVPSMPSRDVHGRYSTSRLSLTGRLQELYDDGFASPVTIAAGTNVVSAARDVCEQMGLEVVSDASSCVTSRVRTYGIGERSDSSVGDTKLDMADHTRFSIALTTTFTKAFASQRRPSEDCLQSVSLMEEQR